MPEKTVQLVKGTAPILYIEVDAETWRNYSMDGSKYENVRCLVSQLIDKEGNSICIINKLFYFKTNKRIGKFGRVIILPRELVLNYGIKSNLAIDLELTEYNKIPTVSTEIYPKRLSIGKIEIMPKDYKGVPISSVNLLITTKFMDEYYTDLVLEINRTYSYGLYTATLVLVRKLFENLIIDLLRIKYGMPRIDLFYWKERHFFHNLSTLIKNLRENVSDFKMFTQAFNDDFFKFLDEIREKANAGAHSLDIRPNPDDINNWKHSINEYSEVILRIIQKIIETPKE